MQIYVYECIIVYEDERIYVYGVYIGLSICDYLLVYMNIYVYMYICV